MRRMTTGRGSEPRAQCSSSAPSSTTSALALSNSTVARRTVQTLMGSYVALSTRTRPPLQRFEPVGTRPRRRRRCARFEPDRNSVEHRGLRLAGEREPNRLILLGRELVLAAATVDGLAVKACGVAMGDAGEDHAIAGGVEQR